MKLLREYTTEDKLIREYTKDGINVSHRVETPIQEDTSGDVIDLPPNPIVELEKKLKLQEKETEKQKEINAKLLVALGKAGIQIV